MRISDQGCSERAVVQLGVWDLAEPLAFRHRAARFDRIEAVDLFVVQKLYAGRFVERRRDKRSHPLFEGLALRRLQERRRRRTEAKSTSGAGEAAAAARICCNKSRDVLFETCQRSGASTELAQVLQAREHDV